LNTLGSGTLAAITEAMSFPMPGILYSNQVISFCALYHKNLKFFLDPFSRTSIDVVGLKTTFQRATPFKRECG
jgi:hypothetical protein